MKTKEDIGLKLETSYPWRIEQAIEQAEADGFTVVRATDTTLLLDLDDIDSFETYQRMMTSIGSLFDLKEKARWTSKSNKGKHIVVSCKSSTAIARVALQACLGSDKRREAFALGMIADGIDNPIVLFRPKGR